ncbi:hypothetical protein GCM10010109_19820 [Actinoplanes campanulatus]|nr:hypothetical protein GCM10010109_19820 [Actinoplanes campanulatus]GID36500.1 hypothetical protein Aca09nite_30060 [Actinoplanes campanulatus]
MSAEIHRSSFRRSAHTQAATWAATAAIGHAGNHDTATVRAHPLGRCARPQRGDRRNGREQAPRVMGKQHRNHPPSGTATGRDGLVGRDEVRVPKRNETRTSTTKDL